MFGSGWYTLDSWTDLEDREAGDVGRGALSGNAHELPVDQVLAVEGERQQAQNGPAHQQLEGSVWDQQRPLDARTVLDGGPHVLICQFPAPVALCHIRPPRCRSGIASMCAADLASVYAVANK